MKNNVVLFIAILVGFRSYSQEQVFTNKNQSLISLNPSFAGSNGFIRNQFSYKSNRGSSYKSYSVANSFDTYISPLKAGIAVSALTENFANGMAKNNYVSISYAQYFSVMEGKLKLIPSVRLAYSESVLDLEKAGWNPSSNNVPLSKTNDFNLSTGFLAAYKNRVYAGFSISSLNGNDNGFSAYNNSFNYHLSYNLRFSDNLQMQFFAQAQTNIVSSSTYIAANALLYKHIIAGVGLVGNRSPVFSLGYRNNYFTVLAGYDVLDRLLYEPSYKSFEVHASFNLKKKELRQTISSFETW